MQGNLLPNFCMLRENLNGINPHQQSSEKPSFHFQYWSGDWKERRKGGAWRSILCLRQINVFLFKFRKAMLWNSFRWMSLTSFILLSVFSGICRGCHESFPSAFFAKWYLQAKETSSQDRKVSVCFVLLICSF